MLEKRISCACARFSLQSLAWSDDLVMNPSGSDVAEWISNSDSSDTEDRLGLLSQDLLQEPDDFTRFPTFPHIMIFLRWYSGGRSVCICGLLVRASLLIGSFLKPICSADRLLRWSSLTLCIRADAPSVCASPTGFRLLVLFTLSNTLLGGPSLSIRAAILRADRHVLKYI